MNNVQMIGHIAVDSKAGNGVVSSLLAVRRIYKSRDGQDTDFIPLSIFGKQAENFQKMVKKGEQVGVDGSLKTSTYADPMTGEKKYGWSVAVDHFYLLNSERHGSHDGGQQHQDENVYRVDKQLDNLDQILDTVNEDKQPAKPETKPAKQADDDEPISPMPPLGNNQNNRSHVSGNDFSKKVLDNQPSIEQLEQEIAKLKNKAVPF